MKIRPIHSLAFLILGGCAVFFVLHFARSPLPAARKSDAAESPAAVPTSKDFSFGYFPNGWRKIKGDASPDILSIETGYYGFSVDVDRLSKARFGLINDNCDYSQALAAGTERLDDLAPAELSIQLKLDGKVYRAVNCSAGRRVDGNRMSDALLWESARLVQHFSLNDVQFADEAGNVLGCSASLDLVAWPDSLTLTADLTPRFVSRDAAAKGVAGAGWSVASATLDLANSKDHDPSNFTVECWFKFPEANPPAQYPAWILCRNQSNDVDGNYGFTLNPNNTVTASMNIGGNKENSHEIAAKSNVPLTPDVWHLLALTYEGQTMTFYIDGKAVGTKKIGRARTPANSSLQIGQRADGKRQTAPVTYDQIRIWDRAVTSQEIAAHASQPTKIDARNGLVFEENFDVYNGKFTPPLWTNAQISVGLKSHAHDWHAQQAVTGEWNEGEHKRVSLTCDVLEGRLPQKDIAVRLLNQDFPVQFEANNNCHVTRVKNPKRTWDRTKCEDLREYDEFLIEVENKSVKNGNIPFLLDFTSPFGITGLCPILCGADGTPTGIPVQLSKNWHHNKLGCYLRAYTLLPAPVGKSTYLMRVPYGFYGTLPQASHAQLSLASDARWGNNGGNGRWDQIAVGGWGETLCLDMDFSLTENIITDNRAMLIRNGKEGPKWGWCEAGWGGDWLGLKDSAGKQLLLNGIKTSYLSHGPCLSDVRYDGHYGSSREVKLKSTVRVPRSDDYVRTYFEQSYDFNGTFPTKGAWLFKMGKTHKLVTPRVAYGNRDGLITEHQAPAKAKPGNLMVDHLELTGEGPWWVAYPDADVQLPPGRENFGKASRAFIIRSFKATFGGKTVTKPSISLIVGNVLPDGRLDIDCVMVPPKDVTEFQPGDRVEMDVEWINVPRIAEDYYGPNEALRTHLAEAPRSWKTVHREAIGNDLTVSASGGTVTHRYPIIIHAKEPLVSMNAVKDLANKLPSSWADIGLPNRVIPWLRPSVTVDIKGGVGYVPIRFDGLPIADGYRLYEQVAGKLIPLDQSLHGNDFWQADYEATTKTYSLTYNLPLDGKPTSRWVFKSIK